MGRRSGIITLTSDFGTRDAYVGAMKGVICGILPGAHIIDITHEVRPQQIVQGALVIKEAFPWFPPGTVHMVVVDPGVGTKRRALAVKADGHLFVGPDNGVLSAALTARQYSAHEITEAAFELPERSETFHGRDVFAPAAAHLASGLEIDHLGREIPDAVIIELPRPHLAGNELSGEIIHIDRFGNAISSIPRRALPEAGSEPYTVIAGETDYGPLRRRFQDVGAGEALALTGSGGHVEIAINGGNAAESLGLSLGTRVVIRAMGPKGGSR